MQELPACTTHAEASGPTPVRAAARPHPGISPVATVLTLLSVALAVATGIAAPRLRDRHASAQQEATIDELATVAAMHESRALLDMSRGRARDAALALIDEIARETVGRDTCADLADAGLHPVDARIVELAPDLRGAMVLYGTDEGDRTVSVTMLPDRGHAVRLDGFGRAVPLAPGDEWLDAVVDAESAAAGSTAGPRVAYAFADGRVLWIVLADDRRTIRAVARRLL
jgi:hypothetical protein